MARLVFDLKPLPIWGTETPERAEEHNCEIIEWFARHYPDETPKPCDCGYFEPVHLVRCTEKHQRRHCRRDALKRLERAYRERHLKALRQKRVCPPTPYAGAGPGICWWCGDGLPRTKAGNFVQRVFHNGRKGEPKCGYHHRLHTQTPVQLEYLLQRRGPRCAGCGELHGAWARRRPTSPERLREIWGQTSYPADVWVGPLCTAWWQTSLEVDHKVALALVAHLPDDERRPYFGPINLQLLCADCHKAKTRSDRAKIRALQRELEAGLEPPLATESPA